MGGWPWAPLFCGHQGSRDRRVGGSGGGAGQAEVWKDGNWTPDLGEVREGAQGGRDPDASPGMTGLPAQPNRGDGW